MLKAEIEKVKELAERIAREEIRAALAGYVTKEDLAKALSKLQQAPAAKAKG